MLHESKHIPGTNQYQVLKIVSCLPDSLYLSMQYCVSLYLSV